VNNQLKQRLVGAIVLVALAVIFIPMLLPGEGDLSGGIKTTNIPPEPDFRFPPIPSAPSEPPVASAAYVPLGDDDADEPKASETVVVASKPVAKAVAKPESKPAEKQKAPVKSVTKPKPVAKPKPAAPVHRPMSVKKSSGRVEGWVVQVGSFSARNNARGLRDKLRQQGHASFVERINGSAGPVYRVRVGPELSKQAATQLRKRLEKEAGLKGLVQAYP
jgi:DedD protein